jgi:hypothetical protein
LESVDEASSEKLEPETVEQPKKPKKSKAKKAAKESKPKKEPDIS